MALMDLLELDFKLDSNPRRSGGDVQTYPLPPPEGPFGRLAPRNLPPPPRVADTNEIELGDDE